MTKQSNNLRKQSRKTDGAALLTELPPRGWNRVDFQISRIVGIGALGLGMDAMRDRIEALSAFDKIKLAKVCDAGLSNWQIRIHPSRRLDLVLILIALAPHSEATIAKWLSVFSGRGVFDVQFSLFLFLGEAYSGCPRDRFRHRVLELAERYLMNVRVKTGEAARGAGYFLARDVPLNHGLPALTRVAAQSQYAAGRDGAVYGLSQVAGGSNVSGYCRRQALDALRTVRASDRSYGLRVAAEMALKAARRGPKGRQE